MNIHQTVKRFLGKTRRQLDNLRLWWNTDWGKPKPVYDHNQKKIVYTDECRIVEIRARLKSENARKINPVGAQSNPSYGLTFDKTSAREFLQTSSYALMRDLEIEYMRVYDKDGLHVLETITGEKGALITRLFDKTLVKA